MLYAGIDIHKRVFQWWCSDPETGELSESRFEPSRERLNDWAMEWRGKLVAVAIEATTGWRWVARELEAHGFEVHLVDPGRASARRGRRRQPKTDRLDARWLALLLARELLSECEAWLPPAEIQRLRDRTRLRKALAGDRTGWAQGLHALLAHESWPCSRGRLLTGEGRRWVAALELDPHVRALIDVIVAVIAALEEQLESVESELRRHARADRRCQALQAIFGVGPILACHLLAEIGDVGRFQRPRQLVRASVCVPEIQFRRSQPGLTPGARPRRKRVLESSAGDVEQSLRAEGLFAAKVGPSIRSARKLTGLRGEFVFVEQSAEAVARLQ